ALASPIPDAPPVTIEEDPSNLILGIRCHPFVSRTESGSAHLRWSPAPTTTPVMVVDPGTAST
ncbi:MAG: hypothetical protein AAGC91_15285, partial [Pseudomonadota bacterium]